MDNPQFLALIHHLGDDVAYVSRRMEQDVTKHVGNLKSTGDVKKFCHKLAGVLLNFRMYATRYAHTLEERILTYQLEGELADVLATLNEVTQKKEKQCEPNSETPKKVEVTTQTELEDQAQTDSSQATELYIIENDMLLTDKEVGSEITECPALENDTMISNPESLHSLLSQETVPNLCNNTDATDTFNGPINCDQEIEQHQSQNDITNNSVDPEIKDTLDHLLDQVCTALSKSGEEVDHLLEELSNTISSRSPNTNQREKLDFLKTLNVAPNHEEPVKKKLTDENRLALLKIIKQFFVKKIRGRRSRKIVAEESSSDEMPPVQKPRRKKMKRSSTNEKQGEGAVVEEENNIPAQLTVTDSDKNEVSILNLRWRCLTIKGVCG